MDYGTDIASHGRLDSKGQVPLVSGVDNVRQALRNRLLTELDVYFESCDDYGTTLRDSLKEELNNQNIEWLKMDIKLTVLKDPRVASCEVEYTQENKFRYYYQLIDDDTEYFEEVS